MGKRFEYLVQLFTVLVLVVGCFLVLRPFLAATLLAAVICITSWPVYESLLRRFKGRKNWAALTMTIALTLVVILPLALVAMTGLKPEVGIQYPSELSGGMMKRAALARALALDPELLFLDEPTTGLDPESAGEVDQLVRKLRDMFGLTIVMVTHDLDLLWQLADRVAVLADGKVQGVGSMAELEKMDNPAIRVFFAGARGRSAQKYGKSQLAVAIN